MEPRKTTNVHIDESVIKSGDTFHILRLDGVDPMIAWAMGSKVGIQINIYIYITQVM